MGEKKSLTCQAEAGAQTHELWAVIGGDSRLGTPTIRLWRCTSCGNIRTEPPNT